MLSCRNVNFLIPFFSLYVHNVWAAFFYLYYKIACDIEILLLINVLYIQYQTYSYLSNFLFLLFLYSYHSHIPFQNFFCFINSLKKKKKSFLKVKMHCVAHPI